MLITYFDEVKYQEGKQPYFWMSALVADADQIWRLEERLNVLSQATFGYSLPTKETEFHASAIVAGIEHFKGWDKERRYALLNSLLDVYCSEPALGKIVIRIDPSLMVAGKQDYEEWAFKFLLERTDMYLSERNLPGILIGDRDDEVSSVKFADYLARYRRYGTSGPYGRNLKYLIDTAHFTSSHLSRMLQLADFHAWLRQVGARSKRYYLTDTLVKRASDGGVAYSIDNCKFWPTTSSPWYQRSLTSNI